MGHLEIFLEPVHPIFFIGINIAEAVKRKETVGGSAIWMIVIIFVIALSSCLFLEQEKHGQFPLFLERMLYIPLTFTSIILFNQVLHHIPKYINKILKVFGALSLELYLIHSHFVLDYLEQTDWSYWHKFVVTTVISLIFAWLLQTVIKGIITPIENRIKMKNLILLIRPHQWIKNLIVFLPVFFGGAFTAMGSGLRRIYHSLVF